MTQYQILKSVSNMFESTNTSMKPQSPYMDNAGKLISISDKMMPCNVNIEWHKNQLHINSTHCGANQDTVGSNSNESDEDGIMTHVDEQQPSNELDIDRKEQDELTNLFENLHGMKVMECI